MNNSEIQLRIAELEEEITQLKASIVDPRVAIREQRDLVLNRELIPNANCLGQIKTALTSLLRNTVSRGTHFNKIEDADELAAISEMQDDILAIITKYYQIGRELYINRYRDNIETFKSAVCDYYQLRNIDYDASIVIKRKLEHMQRELLLLGYTITEIRTFAQEAKDSL